jgi:hypothetical protein
MKEKGDRMKVSSGFIVIATAMLLFFPPSIAMASGQELQGPLNELSVDLATPIFWNLAPDGYAIPIYVNYQRVLTSHLVVSVTPSILYLYGHHQGGSFAAMMWVELDWHPFQYGLHGFFIGPAVVGIYSNGLLTPGSAGVTAMGGATIGYQIFLASNIDFDIAAGVALGPDPGDFSLLSGMPRMVLALGYRF